MGIASNAPYTLLIGDKSFPILAEGYSLKQVAGAEGKHQTSSCRVAVRGSSVLSDVMYADELLEAKVRNSLGDTIFTGVIRPYASVTVNQTYLDAVQLDILDYTEKMHVKVYEDVEEDIQYGEDVIFSQAWTDVKVCDPSDTTHSIVHLLCELQSITLLEAPSIPVELYAFSLEAGQYLDDILSTLLYEYMYDYRFDESGRMIIFQTGPIHSSTDESVADIVGTPVTVTSFRRKMDIVRSDEPKDGAVVTYPKYETRDNVTLWSKSYGRYLFITAGITTVADDDVKWDKSALKDAKNITLSGFWLSFKDTSSGWAGTNCVKKNLSNCTQSGGHVYCRVNVGSFIFGTPKCEIAVKANARYLTNDTRRIGYAGNNSESYTARYIQDKEHALALAYAIRTRAKYNNFSYKFESFAELTPGQVISLQEPNVAGVTATVRIISRTITDTTGLYEYEAEGYGASEFSEPVLDKDDTVDQPQDDPDFLLLKVNTDLIFPDATDMSPVICDTYGLVYDKYGATPVWKLNNIVLEDMTDLHIELSRSLFSPGQNIVSVTATYDGKDYTVSLPVRVFDANLSISMQYAILEEGQEPDSGTVWLDSQPNPETGQVVWVRFRTSATAEWIVLRWTGENGGNPIVYFQWAATPYVSPDDGLDLLTWDSTAIVWDNPDGTITGFGVPAGEWSTAVPEKQEGLNFLWIKYWSYQTQSWNFFCTTGTPAQSFDLVVNPQTYKLTSRGVVAAGTNNEDQRIIVHCQRINSTAPASWELDDGTEEGQSSIVSWDEDWTGFSNTDRCIIIPAGHALQSFTIRCSVADINMTKEFVVTGVQEGKAESMYLGIYDSLAELSQVSSTTEGKLMIGDYAVVETDDGKRKPYYWTGSEWTFAGMNTPVGVAGKVMMGTLYDVLVSEATEDSLSVIDLFVKNLATDNLFANYAVLHNLIVGSGDGTVGSGLKVHIGYKEDGKTRDGTVGSGLKVHIGYKEDGKTPVFEIMWGDNTVYSVNPDTGNMSIGDYYAGGGLFWNALEKQLFFSGEGLFKGRIDCPSFSSLPHKYIELQCNCPSAAEGQFSELRTTYWAVLTINKGLYQCTHSLDNKIKWMNAYMHVYLGHVFDFYDSSYNSVGRVLCSNSREYQSTWDGLSFSVTVRYGDGDVFIFKDLPTDSAGLEPGQVWNDKGTLKIYISE